MSRFDLPLSPLDNPVVDAANALRQGVCRIRRNYPELWQPVNATGGGLAPNPLVRGLNRRAWDYICPDEPINSSFYPEGGQCPNIAYDIQLVDSNGANRAWTFSSGGGFVLGPIDEIRRELSVTNPNNSSQFQNITYRLVKNGVVVRTRSFGVPGNFQVTAGWFVRIITQNNVPDTCAGAPILRGNLPPIQINIPVNLGGQNVNIPFDLDFNLDLGGIPININPTFNTPIGIVSFPPGAIDVDFNPEFVFAPDVSVGGGGEGGASPQEIENIVNNNNQTINDIVNNNINQVIQSDLEPLLCCISNNIRLLFDAPEYDIQNNVFINQTGDIFALPEGCVGVIIRANQPIPAGVSGQEGSGNSPRVRHLGWVAFGVPGVDGGVRIPWQFEEQYVECSEAATRVVVSANFGATFNLSFVVKRPVESVDCCQ